MRRNRKIRPPKAGWRRTTTLQGYSAHYSTAWIYNTVRQMGPASISFIFSPPSALSPLLTPLYFYCSTSVLQSTNFRRLPRLWKLLTDLTSRPNESPSNLVSHLFFVTVFFVLLTVCESRGRGGSIRDARNSHSSVSREQ